MPKTDAETWYYLHQMVQEKLDVHMHKNKPISIALHKNNFH